MEDLLAIGSAGYFLMAGLLLFSRGADFLSTWIATPNLALEANPLARKLGWRWGIILNLVLCLGLAVSPFLAIMISTTSILVAARNFQLAWLMRSMGEAQYRCLMAEQLARIGFRVYLFCILSQAALTGVVGAAVMWFSESLLVPAAIGMGILAYAAAVVFYTLLSVWRVRRVSL